MFIIESRYQWLSKEGWIWTKWFKIMGLSFDDESDAKNHIKESSKKILKSKYEYRVVKGD